MRTPRWTRSRTALLAVAASLALAGCFDGSDDDDDDTPDNGPPPASASASSEGFIAYIASLADGMFDSSEPIDLEAFTAPTDDVDDQPPAETPADE